MVFVKLLWRGFADLKQRTLSFHHLHSANKVIDILLIHWHDARRAQDVRTNPAPKIKQPWLTTAWQTKGGSSAPLSWRHHGLATQARVTRPFMPPLSCVISARSGSIINLFKRTALYLSDCLRCWWCMFDLLRLRDGWPVCLCCQRLDGSLGY